MTTAACPTTEPAATPFEVPGSLAAYAAILKARGEDAHKALWQLQRLLAGIPIRGARILDIGAGWGRHTLYFAAAGAREVVALEPEAAGAAHGTVARLEHLVKAWELPNVRLLREDFMGARLEETSFDLVFAHAVINHMYETREIIRADAAAGRYYLRAFDRMRRLLRPGGVVLIVDASRRNVGYLLQMFGLRHPLMADVDWRLHQSPPTWQYLMRRAGFRRFELHYTCPYLLRRLARWCDNALTDFFTYGLFSIRAWC